MAIKLLMFERGFHLGLFSTITTAPFDSLTTVRGRTSVIFHPPHHSKKILSPIPFRVPESDINLQNSKGDSMLTTPGILPY